MDNIQHGDTFVMFMLDVYNFKLELTRKYSR